MNYYKNKYSSLDYNDAYWFIQWINENVPEDKTDILDFFYHGNPLLNVLLDKEFVASMTLWNVNRISTSDKTDDKFNQDIYEKIRIIGTFTR